MDCGPIRFVVLNGTAENRENPINFIRLANINPLGIRPKTDTLKGEIFLRSTRIFLINIKRRRI